jgi:prepilin peptidase CpaA
VAAGETVQTIGVAIAIGVLLVIAYGDMRTRRIPNALAAAIAGLGLARMVLAADPVATADTVAASAAILAVAFLLYWRGILGGGDAKLVAAMALLIGFRDLFDFLLLMSVCGGVLAFAILARDKLRPHRWRLSPASMLSMSGAATARSTVPYGVAIAAAGVAMLILKPVL